MKVILLVFSLTFPVSASEFKNKCLNKKEGASCYKAGLNVFSNISSALNKEMGEEIKVKASKYFELGCQYKNEASCFEYGKFLLYKNEKKGKMILRKSCARGYSLSCDSLKK